MLEFEYFKSASADQYTFYRIPKVLFTEQIFRKLSCEARVLYGLMLDRIGLSIKNNWVDNEGRVYIIFTAEEITELMGCAKQKAYRLLAELDTDEGIGLIERCRRGQGKVNIIYVKNFIQHKGYVLAGEAGESASIKPDNVTVKNPEGYKEGSDAQEYDIHTSGNLKNDTGHASFPKEYENHTSDNMNFIGQEVLKSYPNDTNKNDINTNDINRIQSSSSPCMSCTAQPEKAYDARGEEVKRWSIIREDIKEMIGYDVLCLNYEQERVDEILEIITEIVSGKRKSMMIGGERVPGEVVRGRFRKIDMSHVQYVFNCLDESRVRIRNVKKYLIASLYNAPTTITAFYSNQVRADGVV